MTNWRPIKTAPKDQIILLAQPPHSDEYPWTVMQGRWIEQPHTQVMLKCLRENQPVPVAPVNPCWLGCYHGLMRGGSHLYDGLSYEERPLVLYPTHWRPLPEPPQPRKLKHKRKSRKL